MHFNVRSVGCTCAEPLELLDQLHGRSLLGKKGDPAKSAWEPKTNRMSETVFGQASLLGLIPSVWPKGISPFVHMLWYTRCSAASCAFLHHCACKMLRCAPFHVISTVPGAAA